jgi:hypothetical protein
VDEECIVSERQASLRRGTNPVGRLTADDAFLALLIGAMRANGRISAHEGTRAQSIIWSMRRFRRRSGDTVHAHISRVREVIDRHGAPAVIEAAARAIPARLRPAAYALAADLVLTDGRIERAERTFLDGLAATLGLARGTSKNIIDVMLIKNSA